MAQVILYTCWANPFCKSVEIALKFKGISFTLIEENLFNPSLEVRKKSPLCPYPPILVHKGHSISDASVILEYIDETWKENSLFPKDPKDRAKARSLIKFIELKCIPAVMRACWGRQWQNNTQISSIQNAENFLKTLENQLNGSNKYFGGDSIGAVDISAIFIALWAEVHGEANAIILPRNNQFPMLSKWISNILNNNIIKETLPQRDVLLSYHRKIHPQDFFRPSTKIFGQNEPKSDRSLEQNVEKLERDYNGCFGNLKKFLTRRRTYKFVFPTDFSK